MKLAILTDGIYPFVIGGMQKHSYYLTKLLASQGVEILLYHCITSGDIPSEEKVREALDIPQEAKFTSKCYRFPRMMKLPGHYIRESFAFSLQIWKDIESELNSFDLIYVKGFAGWALMNKKRKGLQTPPVCVKFHGYEMYQQPPSFRSKLEHYLLRGPVKFNNIHSNYVFSYGGKITPIVESLGVPKNQIVDIPSGIEEDWIITDTPKTRTEATRFLFIGRYERRKGIEELNEVLSELPKDLDFAFDFVGPIPPSKKLKDDRITYHGKIMERDKLQAVMEHCDVLVTPSHSEGMPNVIMEGMARGLAVIATDVGAVPLQVDDANGWRLAPGDKPALNQAINEAINISSEALSVKKKASVSRIKENFTWEIICQEHLKEFKRIVSKG